MIRERAIASLDSARRQGKESGDDEYQSIPGLEWPSQEYFGAGLRWRHLEKGSGATFTLAFPARSQSAEGATG